MLSSPNQYNGIVRDSLRPLIGLIQYGKKSVCVSRRQKIAGRVKCDPKKDLSRDFTDSHNSRPPSR